MEIKLDKDGKISDTAEIRSLLHYCLEYMHYTLGVYYLQPQDDIGVLTSSDWHITPQVIGKYNPTSEFAECVECMLVYDTVFTTIPQSALSRSPQIEKKKAQAHFRFNRYAYTSIPTTSSVKAVSGCDCCKGCLTRQSNSGICFTLSCVISFREAA